MPSKTVFFFLTALGTLASSYGFNYLFFWLRDAYGFSDRDNLLIASLHGAIYVAAAVKCGQFAERRGPRTSLQVGFGGLAIVMLAGWFVSTAWATVLFAAVYTVVLLFIWPAMEALVVDGEPPHRVPHMVGLYNATWSGFAAMAYFTGGPLYDWLGAGAIFGAPCVLFVIGFVVARRTSASMSPARDPAPEVIVPAPHPEPAARRQPVPPETFRTLAWIANPLAYVAIYTLLALMPGVATRLGLSPTDVGLFCSIWFFARWLAFLGLWHWTAWHYKFRWLAAAYVWLVVSFLAVLVSPALWVVVMAQVVFGGAAGLIYYSSLFYSMDLAEAKAEHGGVHEALIGAGIFLGPAVGATSAWLAPRTEWASAVAVAGLLGCGAAALGWVWGRAKWVGVRA